MLTYVVRRVLVAIPTLFGVATVVFSLLRLLPGDPATLIEQGNSGTSPAARQKSYCDAAKQVWKDAPWIFLYNQKNPIVTSAKVTNVTGLPNEKFVTTWASPA